jgi:integrase/recombinase XerD
MSTLQMAFDIFVDSMTGTKSPATVRWYRKRLALMVKFIGPDVELTGITLADLRRWRSSLVNQDVLYSSGRSMRPARPGHLSPWTLQGYQRSAKRFFSFCEEDELIISNPAKRLESIRVPRIAFKGLSSTEMQSIIEVVKDDPRDHAMLLFLADTGCRRAGLLGLHISDLDLGQGTAIVTEKGSIDRDLYLSKPTIEALKCWLNFRPNYRSDWVWTSKTTSVEGLALTGAGLRAVLRAAAQKAGVKARCNPHSWRHGFARSMLSAGAPLSVVSQLLGHRSIAVTADFYGGLSQPQLRAAHREYGWVSAHMVELDHQLSPNQRARL